MTIELFEITIRKALEELCKSAQFTVSSLCHEYGLGLDAGMGCYTAMLGDTPIYDVFGYLDPSIGAMLDYKPSGSLHCSLGSMLSSISSPDFDPWVVVHDYDRDASVLMALADFRPEHLDHEVETVVYGPVSKALADKLSEIRKLAVLPIHFSVY